MQVHGHRGARAARPENTLAAFEYAIAAGADYIELDLAVTRDDVLVVSHDPLFNPVICRGEDMRLSPVIRELTVEQVRAWDCGSLRHPHFPKQVPVPGARIPTLDEILALASPGPAGVNIEVKTFPQRPEFTPPPRDYAELVRDAVHRSGMAARVIVQSFDFRILHAMADLAPEIRLAALWERGAEDFASIARDAGASIVAPHHVLVTPEKVAAARRKSLAVIPWTANGRSNWDRLIRAQVDGIITDDPAGLIAFLRKRAAPSASIFDF
jgi:glycerophosphoryl diester phosphodiesterase